MKFRRSGPGLLITAAIVVIVSISVLSNILFSGMTTSVEEAQLTLMRTIVDFSLRGAENKALSRASMIANLPRVKELYAARNRDGLAAELEPMFKEQKEKFGVDQAQFHVPPLTSFLRLHSPETFGDDVSKVRPMIVIVHRDQIPKSGFSIAHFGPGIFGIAPVFDAGRKFIGSFEFGLAFNPILDSLKEAYDLDLAVFIKEDALKTFAPGLPPGTYSDQNRVGPYIRYYTTNTMLVQALVTDRDLNPGVENFVHQALGKPYGVVLVPIRNASGETLGLITVAKDFSASRGAESRSVVWQMLMALCAIVALAGCILIVIRGVLLRPLGALSAKFARLADGDRGDDTPCEEAVCDELAELSNSYAKLRGEGK